MGTYDEYGCVQLKVGPCELNQYEPGDRVPIADGAYLGYEGIIVVKRGVFVVYVKHLFNKWGEKLRIADILRQHNPIHQVIKEFTDEPTPNKK